MPAFSQSTLALTTGRWRVIMTTHDLGGAITRSDEIGSIKSCFGDGRYVREEIAGPFGGKQHEKMTVLGYNETRARFEFFPADNHDGVLLLYTGEPGADAGTREIVMSAEYAAPDETGEARPASFVRVHTVITIEDRNRHSLRTFYRPGGAPERLFLELMYVRDD